MAGVNRALTENFRVLAKTSIGLKPCIFLSHISIDKDAVREIGKYIMNQGDVDIYLDENDQDLQRAVRERDDLKITNFIEKGILSSTHLMCLVSEKTVNSWWVPYEIGFAKKSEKGIATLKLKGEVELPSFLEIGDIIKGTQSLNSYLKKLCGELRKAYGYHIINENVISHTALQHPLDKHLDWQK